MYKIPFLFQRRTFVITTLRFVNKALSEMTSHRQLITAVSSARESPDNITGTFHTRILEPFFVRP